MSNAYMDDEVNKCLKEILNTLRSSSTSEQEVTKEKTEEKVEGLLEQSLRNLGEER